MKTLLSALPCALLFSISAQAVTYDGQSIPSEGLTLRATQTSPTAFGDSTGTQAASGGSELNAVYADISGGTLNLGITGNLEGNFNKMFVFFDAVSGGENVLANDNADNGFGEINGLAGLTFANGMTADHGLRFEVGTGFYGVNAFDLIDNTAFGVASGGGPGDLPLTAVGSGGVTVGWDNSNALGVDGSSAAGALTATTGWEIGIDMSQLFGAIPLQNVGVSILITSSDGTFLSNQILPGISGGSTLNPGDPSLVTVENFSLVPEPSAYALIFGGIALFCVLRRR